VELLEDMIWPAFRDARQNMLRLEPKLLEKAMRLNEARAFE
jgi:DNA-binding protein YbaB